MVPKEVHVAAEKYAKVSTTLWLFISISGVQAASIKHLIMSSCHAEM